MNRLVVGGVGGRKTDTSVHEHAALPPDFQIFTWIAVAAAAAAAAE